MCSSSQFNKSTLNRRILEKKEVSWQDKKKVQDLINQQQQIEQQIENLKKENKENKTI